MTTPQRIQRKRTKGYKLPPNTVCVNRGTKWGNPFRVVQLPNKLWSVKTSEERYFNILTSNCHVDYPTKEQAAKDAVKCYSIIMANGQYQIQKTSEGYEVRTFGGILCHDLALKTKSEANKLVIKLIEEEIFERTGKELKLAEIRGKNLACFCRENETCHADVLLEILSNIE